MSEEKELDALSVAIGRNIAARRQEISMTGSDLHRATGITRSALTNYEKGRHQPRAAELMKICEALECSPNRLLYGTDETKADRSLGVAFVDTGDDYKNTVRMVFALLALRKSDRDAVMRLVASLIEGYGGKENFDAMARVADVIAESMTPVLEEAVESHDWSQLEQQLRQEKMKL